MKDLLKPLLSRKFIFAILATLCGFYLTVSGKADAQEFFNFISIIGGIYVVGNVSGKVSGTIGERLSDKFTQ